MDSVTKLHICHHMNVVIVKSSSVVPVSAAVVCSEYDGHIVIAGKP